MTSDRSEDSVPYELNDSDLAFDESLAAKVVARLDRQWGGQRRTINGELGSLVGQQLANYRIQQTIGRGAFGVVYLATDSRLNRPVALKVPRDEVLVNSERFGRFKREAELAARLEHAGIVPVYEANFEGATPFIAYAYCSGPDLGKWLSGRAEPVTALQAAQFAAHIAEAVDFAHSRGVARRFGTICRG